MLASEFLNMRLGLVQGKFDNIEQNIKRIRELLLEEKQFDLISTLDICHMVIASSLDRPQDIPEWLAEGTLSETVMMFPAMPILHTYYNQMLLAKGEYTSVIARKDECLEIYGIFSNVLCILWLHIQLAAAYEKIGRAKDA